MGEWKISGKNCEAWFGKSGKNSLRVLPVGDPDGCAKSGDILYKKGDGYQVNFSTRRLEE
jgi:hypothetical protein